MVTINPTNGVSYAYTYTVTADDDTAGYVDFRIKSTYKIAAILRVVNSSNVNIPLSDAVITYPNAYTVRLADGAATFAVTATYKVTVIIARDNS
jgi:hypothetical protein